MKLVRRKLRFDSHSSNLATSFFRLSNSSGHQRIAVPPVLWCAPPFLKTTLRVPSCLFVDTIIPYLDIVLRKSSGITRNMLSPSFTILLASTLGTTSIFPKSLPVGDSLVTAAFRSSIQRTALFIHSNAAFPGVSASTFSAIREIDCISSCKELNNVLPVKRNKMNSPRFPTKESASG